MENIFLDYGYLGLFAASFLAATILPIGSELFFIAMIATGYDAWICTIVASIGNWLGGMLNYFLGRLGKIEWIEKYFKVSKGKIEKIQNWLKGKGAWFAFFSFLPAIGDLIAFSLGFMRANVYIVNISMFLGKFLRYVALVYGIKYSIWWLV